MSLELLLEAAEYIEKREKAEHGYASLRYQDPAHLSHKKSSKKFPGKRSSHNELEKCRRAYLRNCLNGLKELVPLDANTYRHTTLGLLNKAKLHIKNLEENAKSLSRRKEKLFSEQRRLRQNLANLILERTSNSTNNQATSLPSSLIISAESKPNDKTEFFAYNLPRPFQSINIGRNIDNDKTSLSIVNINAKSNNTIGFTKTNMVSLLTSRVPNKKYRTDSESSSLSCNSNISSLMSMRSIEFSNSDKSPSIVKNRIEMDDVCKDVVMKEISREKDGGFKEEAFSSTSSGFSSENNSDDFDHLSESDESCSNEESSVQEESGYLPQY
ncbi:uncharacterized protein LOC135926039 isoform X2 [Gordionus sp. m RMFG-2023]|uniref:uncharacterized protein LOC135926039 isoform X2 n=1 Tax=Gordionus sp. m RMFG-2023 TaxID=3053472 RepID=UPI0031FD66AC